MNAIVKPVLLPSERTTVLEVQSEDILDNTSSGLFNAQAISDTALKHHSGFHTVSKNKMEIKRSHGHIMSGLNAAGNRFLRFLGIRKKNITQQNISDVLRIAIEHYKKNTVSVDKLKTLDQLREIETIGTTYFSNKLGPSKNDKIRLRLLKRLNGDVKSKITKDELKSLRISLIYFCDMLIHTGFNISEVTECLKDAEFDAFEVGEYLIKERKLNPSNAFEYLKDAGFDESVAKQITDTTKNMTTIKPDIYPSTPHTQNARKSGAIKYTTFLAAFSENTNFEDFTKLRKVDQVTRLTSLIIRLPQLDETVWVLNFEDKNWEKIGPKNNGGFLPLFMDDGKFDQRFKNDAISAEDYEKTVLKTEEGDQIWTPDQRKLFHTACSYLWAAISSDIDRVGKNDHSMVKVNKLSNSPNFRLVALRMAANQLEYTEIDPIVQDFFLKCVLGK